ncbi:MAG TPA: hypothetical protein PK447_08925 [Ignavibacteria bacterium]|nr:hypothetical protein [Ignavibacteria bacterium]
MIVKNIGEELQDDIDEYDEYSNSGDEYFNEEFFGDDENGKKNVPKKFSGTF